MKQFFYHLLLFLPLAVFANPKGHQVVRGSAGVKEHGNLVEVQTSDRAIINWDEFSIGKQETTRFVQPNSGSAVLNRVSQGTSHIDGLLEGNGRIYLLNPNGLIIGPKGCIQAETFVASTLDLSNEDFFKNNDLLFRGDSKARIVNFGKIEALGGDVFLLGRAIVNEGTVKAAEGTVGFAAAGEILLKPSGMQRLYIEPSFSEEKEEGGIENKGVIEAAFAHLEADGNAFRFAINQEGCIEARGIYQEKGRIFLVADEGTAVNSGELKAPGGHVRILGKEVGVNSGGTIDVSDFNGGGEFLIGGDFQGSNPEIPNSQMTIVMDNTEIRADGIGNADGGEIIIWSDGMTIMKGRLSASAGELGGDGGFVEVSGKENLCYEGLTSTAAPFGNIGSLLLDPSDISITSAVSNTDINFNAATGTYTATAASGILSAGVLTDQLNMGSGNVEVKTESAFAGMGDIEVMAPIDWSSANSLTLIAEHDIVLSTSSLTSISANGSGNINLIAGQDVNFNDFGSISTASGNILVRATRDVLMQPSVDDALFTVSSIIGGGKTTIEAGRDLLVGNPAVGKGNAGIFLFDGTELSVKTARDLIVQAPATASRGSVIATSGNSTSATTATFEIGRNLRLTAGAESDSSVSIGGTAQTNPANMSFSVVGDVIVEGGAGDNSYALIGYQPSSLLPALIPQGNITFSSAGEVTIEGGTGSGAFAQIGITNNPAVSLGGVGNVSIDAASGSISLTSQESYALIGHGGTNAAAGAETFTGDITVKTSDAITIQSSNQQSCGIGYILAGGVIDSVISNALTVEGKSLTMTGADEDAFIGYSARNEVVPHTTDIEKILVTIDDAITLTGSTPGGSRGTVFIGNESDLNSTEMEIQSGSLTMTNGGIRVVKTSEILTGAMTVSGTSEIVSLDGPIAIGTSGNATFTNTEISSDNGSIAIKSDGGVSLSNATIDGSSGTVTIDAVNAITASTLQLDAGDLSIEGNADVTFESFTGAIHNTTASIAAGGDLSFSNSTLGSGLSTLSANGSVAVSMTTLQSPQGVSLSSVEDISLQASLVRSSGGPVSAIAGEGITFTNSVFATEEDIVTVQAGADITTMGSDVACLNSDVNMKANEDITIGGGPGANVRASGNGSLSIDAGGNLSSEIVLRSDDQTVTLSAGSDLTLSTSADVLAGGSGGIVMTAGGSITAPVLLEADGGSISITAGGNAAFTGSMVDALRNISMQIGGDLTIGADFVQAGQVVNLVASGTVFGSGAEISASFASLSITGGQGISLSNCSVVAETSTITLDPNQNIDLMSTQLDAFSDISLTALGSILLNGSTIFSQTGSIFAIANQNIQLSEASSILAPVSSVTLVVDNANPESPEIGDAFFALDSTSSLLSGTTLRVYTARQEQNIVAGLFNGEMFFEGIAYVDSDTEQWASYFPKDFGGVPYTFFYKSGIIPNVFNDVGRAFAEMFQNLQTYDELLFTSKCFLYGYDRACYDRHFYPKGMLSSYDLFRDEVKATLRRYYRNYHTKYVESF